MATDSYAYLTTRVSLDCKLFCDGEFLLDLKATLIKKVKIPVGEHILQYVSKGSPTLTIERIMDFSVEGRNYLLLLDDMEKMAKAEAKAKEQARKKEEEEIRPLPTGSQKSPETQPL